VVICMDTTSNGVIPTGMWEVVLLVQPNQATSTSLLVVLTQNT